MRRFFLERVTQPEVEPVTLAQMRAHLRMFDDQTDEDTEITELTTAAREWAEDFTGRALIDQTWRLTITDGEAAYDAVTQPLPYGYVGTCGEAGEILLRRSPVLQIVSFKSVDAKGDETAIDVATYELREAESKWPKLVGLNGATWPSGTYRIVFRAGYADRDVSPAEDGDEVPARFRQAIKVYVSALYDREEKNLAVAEQLILPERCHLDFA